MSEIFKFPTPRPMSDVTKAVEQAIMNCKTIAELDKVKEANKNRITGSYVLEDTYKRKEQQLRNSPKPDLSITYPTKDRFPCDDEQVETHTEQGI